MHPRLSFLLALLLSSTAFGATVSISVSSNGGPTYTTDTGSLLSAGSMIRVGFFDTSGVNLATLQTSNDFTQLNALFTALGEGNTNGGTVNQTNGSGGQTLVINNMFGTGNVLGQIANIDSTYCTPGTQLFAWVFNTNDPLTATQWGIFTASSGWAFPNALGSETLSTAESVQAIRGSTTGGNTTADRLRLAAIPEPSGALLLFSAGALLRLRRFRRR